MVGHADSANYDENFKIILLGDSGVGKTRFMETLFGSSEPLGIITI
jgi:GTPase SAR1 family protein